MDWSKHYPAFYPTKDAKCDKKVEFADIGCGYGGLMIALAPLYPDNLIVGRLPWVDSTLEKRQSLTSVFS
jgi:tRNA G46 methylase TrmB